MSDKIIRNIVINDNNNNSNTKYIIGSDSQYIIHNNNTTVATVLDNINTNITNFRPSGEQNIFYFTNTKPGYSFKMNPGGSVSIGEHFSRTPKKQTGQQDLVFVIGNGESNAHPNNIIEIYSNDNTIYADDATLQVKEVVKTGVCPFFQTTFFKTRKIGRTDYSNIFPFFIQEGEHYYSSGRDIGKFRAHIASWYGEPKNPSSISAPEYYSIFRATGYLDKYAVFKAANNQDPAADGNRTDTYGLQHISFLEIEPNKNGKRRFLCSITCNFSTNYCFGAFAKPVSNGMGYPIASKSNINSDNGYNSSCNYMEFMFDLDYFFYQQGDKEGLMNLNLAPIGSASWSEFSSTSLKGQLMTFRNRAYSLQKEYCGDSDVKIEDNNTTYFNDVRTRTWNGSEWEMTGHDFKNILNNSKIRNPVCIECAYTSPYYSFKWDAVDNWADNTKNELSRYDLSCKFVLEENDENWWVRNEFAKPSWFDTAYNN